MSSLIIVGAGGHGRVIADTAIAAGWSDILFYDDAFPTYRKIGPWDVCGTSQDLLHSRTDTPVVIGIGDNHIRIKKAQELARAGFHFTSVIHPSAIISPSVTIGQGSVIFGGVVMNSCAIIGDHCIINTHATVEHDCHLQTGVHISPNAALGGGTQIGALSWVGIGASVKQGIIIGSSVIVGAGAAVIKNLPNQCTAVGVPARTIKTA
jgi:sugar O-acyltransferase (sialic acid O-acetyltransferase NeuD family)